MTRVFIVSLLLLICACKKSSPVEPTPDPISQPAPPPMIEKFTYSYIPSSKDWTVRGGGVSPLYSTGGVAFSFNMPYGSFDAAVVVEINNSVSHNIQRANSATLSFSVVPQNVPPGSLLAVYGGPSQITRFSMSLGSSQTIQVPSSYFKTQSFGFGFSFQFIRTNPPDAYTCSVSVINISLKASE